MSDFPLILTIGARGSGKSTLARADTAKALRRLTIDPSGDWKRAGVKSAPSLRKLSQEMARCWRGGFDLVYTPPVGREAEALHHVSEMLFHLQGQVLQARKPRVTEGITLVIDEMAEAYSNADGMRGQHQAFRRVILQGRHYGLSVYGITQRPQDIAARFRDNCDTVNAFKLANDTGRASVLDMVGRAHQGLYLGLQRFEYLTLDVASGAVRKAKTRRI